MEKKYILTDETITLDNGIVLHRIKAIRSFGDVNDGNLGGWIEKEDNLSHGGDCWVYDNAKVYGNVRVFDNAKVYGHAKVFENVIVFEDAKVYGHSNVFGNAIVCDNAEVFENACVFDNAKVYGHTKVYGNACVFKNAIVYGHTKVFENAKLYDNAEVFGNAEIRGNAVIQSDKDYIVFKNWWSSGRYFTWTRSNNMWCVGCFYGTGDELVKKAYKDSKISGRGYEQIVKFVKNILLREKITNFFQKLLCFSFHDCISNMVNK